MPPPCLLLQPNGRDQEVMETLFRGMKEALEPIIERSLNYRSSWGPQLMRWSSAFPVGEGLPESLSVCQTSRVLFCGDFVSGRGQGRLEGALHSGHRCGQALARLVGLG